MDQRITTAVAALVAVSLIVIAVKMSSRSPEQLGAIVTPDATTSLVDRRPPVLPDDVGQGTAAEPTTEARRIRDHRAGDPIAYDPDGRTGEKRTAQRLPPDLVKTLSAQLEVAMLACTTDAVVDHKPQVTATVFVDVAGGTLQVTETAIELRGLEAAAKDCMQSRWVGQTVAAPDTVSATHYEISVVFAVPSR